MIAKILIIYENEQGERSSEVCNGDELTSPISEAIIFLQEQQQKELKL